MQKHKAAYQLYLYLAALFITSLVVSNLIFQKFFYWYPFGEVNIFGSRIFEISVGILLYPVTFLITDLISEIFGKKKANQVVTAGIFASLFSLLIIYVSTAAPATDWSPIGDELFRDVFGRTILAVMASMLAYLAAQYVDIHIYHFWKNYTKGRHLWLRNNCSTILSQCIDTMTVLLLLCSFDVIAWERFTGLLIGGVLFKMLIALLDTPLLYFFVYLIRKRFDLEKGEEIQLP
ncbi:queuosine precursor transporter [Sinomicrobium sp. M5D2P17]